MQNGKDYTTISQKREIYTTVSEPFADNFYDNFMLYLSYFKLIFKGNFMFKIVNNFTSFFKKTCIAAFVLVTFSPLALATDTGMPWEGPLEKILSSLSGPVAKILGIIAIVIAGLGLAFGESSGGMRRIFQIVLGLSIAFTASSLIGSLFGFSGGAII